MSCDEVNVLKIMEAQKRRRENLEELSNSQGLVEQLKNTLTAKGEQMMHRLNVELEESKLLKIRIAKLEAELEKALWAFEERDAKAKHLEKEFRLSEQCRNVELQNANKRIKELSQELKDGENDAKSNTALRRELECSEQTLQNERERRHIIEQKYHVLLKEVKRLLLQDKKKCVQGVKRVNSEFTKSDCLEVHNLLQKINSDMESIMAQWQIDIEKKSNHKE